MDNPDDDIDAILSPGLDHGLSTDTSPIHLRIAGHTLHIPRNYIIRASCRFIVPHVPADQPVQWKDGPMGLYLCTSYPEFAGVTEGVMEILKTGPRISENRIKMDKTIISIQRVKRGSISQWLSIDRRPVKADQMGYLRFSRDDRIKLDTGSEGNILIVPSEDYGGIIGWMDMIEPAPGIFFQCSYGIPLLPHWRVIHEKLEALFASFIVQ